MLKRFYTRGKIFIVALAAATLLFGFAVAHAGHTDEALGEVDVHIKGNNRTKRSYMISLVHRCLEKEAPDSWEAVDTEKLRQCVYNSRLFSEVEVTAERPAIRISVKERWTLIPVPNIRASSNEYSAGGFLMESNFLGRGKLLFVGGSYGSEGSSYFLFLNDPSVLFSNWKLGLRLFRAKHEQHAYDGEETVYATEAGFESAGFSVGYRLTPSLEVDAGAYRTSRNYSSIESYPAPDGLSYTSYDFRLEYKRISYRLHFNQGISIRAKHTLHKDKSDGSQDSGESDILARLELNPVSDHALRFRAQWRDTDSDDIRFAIVEGGRRGQRGLQSHGLWYTEGTFLSLDYNVPVSKRKYGTWTVGPFIDHAWYDPVFEESGSTFTAYGMGLNLYFNTITLPGISFEVGRNERFMGDFVTFSLGMWM